MPLPCVSTAFAAKTVPFLAARQAPFLQTDPAVGGCPDLIHGESGGEVERSHEVQPFGGFLARRPSGRMLLQAIESWRKGGPR